LVGACVFVEPSHDRNADVLTQRPQPSLPAERVTTDREVLNAPWMTWLLVVAWRKRDPNTSTSRHE
jgi:hypothetical protein